jgi:hypothetical protein
MFIPVKEEKSPTGHEQYLKGCENGIFDVIQPWSRCPGTTTDDHSKHKQTSFIHPPSHTKGLRSGDPGAFDFL